MSEWAAAAGAPTGMTYFPQGVTGGPGLVQDRIEQFAADDEGRWYFAKCSGANFFGDHAGFEVVRDAYLASNDWYFVPAGEEPPPPEVPVEALMEIAFKEITLPDPEVEWNPKLEGSAATIVNMDTWVWLVDPAQDLTVTATVGANTATVRATQQSMTLAAPDTGDVVCAGSGVEWTAAARGECAIVFTRSSANQPDRKTPLTVTTSWNTSWTANDVDRGALDPQTMTSIVGIPVAEVQTIIN